jgi:ankyrin repeat protein
VEKGFDITKKNSEDLTPLMLSCKLGNIEIAEILLENKANLYEINILGDTSLKLAQKNGHENLVMILIQKYKALARQSAKPVRSNNKI